MDRLRCAWTLTVALALVFPFNAEAQRYPSKAIQLVIPFAAGGRAGNGADRIGRKVAERLAAAFGQPVRVENRPGGGGSVGTELVAKAAPDGYTILLTPLGNVLPETMAGAAGDSSGGFTLITRATEQHVFLAPAGLPTPVLAALYAEIVKALNTEEVGEVLRALNLSVVTTPSRQLARSEETLSRAAEASRAQAGDMFHEAFELFRQGKLDAAAAAFRKGLVSDPKNAVAHFYLAEIYDRQRDNLSARRHYRQVIEYAPNSKEAATARSRLDY